MSAYKQNLENQISGLLNGVIMPRKVILCECGGEVCQIAETQTDIGLHEGDNGEKTVYYQCQKSECGKIFEQRIETAAYSGQQNKEGELKEYKECFTVEQIKEFAPKVSARLSMDKPILPWFSRQPWQGNAEIEQQIRNFERRK